MKKVIFLSVIAVTALSSVEGLSVGRKLLRENQGNASKERPLKSPQKEDLAERRSTLAEVVEENKKLENKVNREAAEDLAEMRSTLAEVVEENKKLERKINETAEKSTETEKQLKNLTAFTGKFYEGTGQLFSCLLNRASKSQRTEQIDTDSALSRALTMFGSTTFDEEPTKESQKLAVVPAKRRRKNDEALSHALKLFSEPSQPIIKSGKPIVEEPEDE